MPLTLILAELPAKRSRDGTPRRSIRDCRFEALYAKSFADMRERSASKH